MKLTIDITPLVLDAAVLDKVDIPKLLEQEMQNQRAAIIKRALAGQGAEGPLKEYSKDYKKLIDSGHIFGKSPGNHTVNLTATGTMLRSMTIERESGSGVHTIRMFFQGSHPSTIYLSSKGAEKKRKKSGGGRPINPNRGARGGSTSRVSAARSAEVTGKYHFPNPRRQFKKLGKGETFGAHSSGITSAGVAEYQYAIGRGGWFQFGKEDVLRIIESLSSKIFKAMKKDVFTK